MIFRPIFILALFTLISLSGLGADTVFVDKHHFPSPVRNVLTVDDQVYVKTGDGLYKKIGNEWQRQPIEFSKSYAFYENGWVEVDYVPQQYIFNAEKMARIIPQSSLTEPTLAVTGNMLFISVGGSLYEYVIHKHYSHSYGNRSVRQIFLERDLKIVSTYSGIFINDSLRAPNPSYASGMACRIGDKIYLCADSLYEFVPPASFRELPAGQNLFAGSSRKLVQFRNAVYSLNTKSLNRFEHFRELVPIHQGEEYYDIELAGDRLIFSTQSGKVLAFDGTSVTQLLQLNSRIRDILVHGNMLFLSSDKGVYTFNGSDSSSLKMIADMPFAVMTLVDQQRNTWISTENGLFVLPDGKKEPIPFILDVEFNRGALTVDVDEIYAGSTSGIYTFNSVSVLKHFLPLHFNKKTADVTAARRKLFFWILSALGLCTIAFIGYRSYKRRHSRLLIPDKEPAKALMLEQVAQDIKLQGIMTVEGLAEFYQTNTVQLNRQFKAFDTTPGRFMKQVKLDYARELLQQKVPLEEVAIKVGYSPIFIRKELRAQS